MLESYEAYHKGMVRVALADLGVNRCGLDMAHKVMSSLRICVWEHHRCIPDTLGQLGKG